MRGNFTTAVRGLGFGAAALFFITGCGWFHDEPPREEGMSISVDFRDVHRCSRISPEITVTDAPKGTKFYDVRLMEYANNGERILGGGQWPAESGGVIPEGALTRHYMGPCPSGSEEYAYIVAAETDEHSQPLAVRLYRFRPE